MLFTLCQIGAFTYEIDLLKKPVLVTRKDIVLFEFTEVDVDYLVLVVITVVVLVICILFKT